MEKINDILNYNNCCIPFSNVAPDLLDERKKAQDIIYSNTITGRDEVQSEGRGGRTTQSASNKVDFDKVEEITNQLLGIADKGTDLYTKISQLWKPSGQPSSVDTDIKVGEQKESNTIWWLVGGVALASAIGIGVLIYIKKGKGSKKG